MRPTARNLSASRSTLGAGVLQSVTATLPACQFSTQRPWRRSPRRRQMISTTRHFRVVAWSLNGATIIAGGSAATRIAGGEERRILRRFDAMGQRQGADIAVSGNTIEDIQPCGKSFAFASADPSFGLISAQGAATNVHGSHDRGHAGEDGHGARGVPRRCLRALRSRPRRQGAGSLRPRSGVPQRFPDF